MLQVPVAGDVMVIVNFGSVQRKNKWLTPRLPLPPIWNDVYLKEYIIFETNRDLWTATQLEL